MADIKSNDTTSVNTTVKMKVDESKEHCPSKQDNSSSKGEKTEEFKMCSPSNPFKTSSTNPFTSEYNNFGKSILKPSLLSVNSASSTSNNFVLRQSSFNPFSKSVNDNQSDSSDKKQMNGEVLKFVPLIKKDSQLSKAVDNTQSNNTANTNSSTSFVFGQNLQERVISDVKSSDPRPSTSSVNSNGNSSGTSDMLFSSAIKTEIKSEVSKERESKSLTESAREYEESRAVKRKYDEVQTKTGEEEETNILSISCKLFSFDKATSNWQERGRGNLRLNDFEIDENHTGSRLVFRAAGSLRVILNTKIWAEMTIDKASEKSIRLTALDSNGEVKVFLIMCSIDEARQLYFQLQARLEKEVSLQKRKKLAADNLGDK